jgi:protein required for attachment to host cells
MTNSTWILVCDASRARLLEEKTKGNGFSVLESFEHPESRARVRDLMADAAGRKPVGPVPAGRNGGPSAAYGRPGAAPDTDPKEVEAVKFARELAGVLEKGLNDHAYQHLVIVAPPHFLGTMKGTVSTQVEKHLEVTIDKDFAGLELPELTKHLHQVLPPA